MMDIGRVCVKLAGRDSTLKCVIVDKIDDTFVLIDGLTRRKRCNIKHLEPLDQVLDIKKGATHAEIVKAFKELGIELVDKKARQKTERPQHLRKAKVVENPDAKKTDKKPKPKNTTEKKEKTEKTEKKLKENKK
jgi:large subunit ribosomal protein L14e